MFSVSFNFNYSKLCFIQADLISAVSFNIIASSYNLYTMSLK